MKINYLPMDFDVNAQFRKLTKVHGSESGVVFTAERSRRWFVIIDQRTMAGLLAPEDFDLMGLMLQSIEFDSIAERDRFVLEEGWLNL